MVVKWWRSWLSRRRTRRSEVALMAAYRCADDVDRQGRERVARLAAAWADEATSPFPVLPPPLLTAGAQHRTRNLRPLSRYSASALWNGRPQMHHDDQEPINPLGVGDAFYPRDRDDRHDDGRWPLARYGGPVASDASNGGRVDRWEEP